MVQEEYDSEFVDVEGDEEGDVDDDNAVDLSFGQQSSGHTSDQVCIAVYIEYLESVCIKQI